MGFVQRQNGTELLDIVSRLLRAPQAILRDALYIGKSAIEHQAPDGLIEEWLLNSSHIEGNKVFIGKYDPAYDQAAPRGTITAFLYWWREQFPSHTIMGANAKYKGLRSRTERPIGGGSWPEAWYFLSQRQKDALKAQRFAGNTSMGGPYPPPSYMGAIDKGKVPGSNAGQGFSNRIMAEINVNMKATILMAMTRA